MPTKIAVIGAGIIGVSTAVQLAEHFRDIAPVTIVTDEFTPNTTSDGAGGLWGPYLTGSTSIDRVLKWGLAGHQFMHNLWKTGHAQEAGICLVPVVRLTDATENYDEFCNDIVFGWHEMSQTEVEQYSKEHSRNYKCGAHFITFTCESSRLIPFLLKKFEKAGGSIRQQKIESFQELTDEFDVIVNAAGLYSGKIANDSSTVPIRGQVIRVDAPWQLHSICDDRPDGNHIIPNSESVLLGGTHQYGNSNRNVDANDKKFIHDGCLGLSKSLKNSKFLKDWIGLRPGRDGIRLEEDQYISATNKMVKIVHNYGHGGGGVTLAWGCGTEVLSIVKKFIDV